MIPYGTGRPLLAPVDRDGSRRTARLRRLGLGERPDASSDSYVLVRRKALVLEDVCDYPRFAGDPVVDDMGIRSYLGAPLIDRTGVALGTVCAVDTVPRAWGRAGLDTIKLPAREFVVQIECREGVHR
ncbi:GAF domain-containing protein [Streptomyces sp. NPDC006978]|uniref:GAF domain-containing protein n=1 Tax=unclassified Streptomyces TaxID=2593676 RepID=UPI002AFE3B3E|nr:GAF domain-containing protein [Streptomyces sp. S584]